MKYILSMLIISLVSSSCSTTSVLIQPDDNAFSKAQTHLQHIEKVVNKLAPSDSESSLFLQAEGFYQYRFTPPKKSNAKYLAEAASAITDFPGFQSLAGSLDMEDLRFRAPDSAVQLWETLLKQHPHTTLKPLTLYRLGWAYRNVGAQGLPRTSPNDAFNQLIKEEPNSKWGKLAKNAKKVPYKTKEEAGFRSLIPGMGQMYLGETQSGFTRLGIAIAGLIAVAVPVYAATHGNHNSLASTAIGLGGLIVLSFDFTDSYEDAIHGVVRWNERAESEFQRRYPTAP
jgi:hypothetical protein